jgi:type III restriction enzyme
MIELKAFQEKAVRDLLSAFRRLINRSEPSICIFKAPTGSGKTIMMAEFLKRLAHEDLDDDYVYIWISLHKLHDQSKAKLTDYLHDSRYNLLTLEELNTDGLPSDSVLFVNWHSLTTTRHNKEGERGWFNVHVRDQEGASIRDVLDKTRHENKQIILIVDEAHSNYLSPNSQRFIAEIIKPAVTLLKYPPHRL